MKRRRNRTADEMRRLGDELDELKAKLAAAERPPGPWQQEADGFAGLIKSGHIATPERLIERHLEYLRNAKGDVAAENRREVLAAMGNEEIIRDLFANEMLLSRSTSGSNQRSVSGFMRGERDAARHKRQGQSMATTSALHELAVKKLAEVVHDSDFREPPQRICEIGGAWGATIRALTDRFHPVEYQNYEIDHTYARFAEEELGATAMPVDGETLSPTETGSMDLVISNNVFFGVPPLKVFGYLKEMARVTAPGGVIVFNLLVAEGFDADMLSTQLDDLFPRRAISLVPRHFIDVSLPEEDFELLREVDEPYCPYFVFRKN